MQGLLGQGQEDFCQQEVGVKEADCYWEVGARGANCYWELGVKGDNCYHQEGGDYRCRKSDFGCQEVELDCHGVVQNPRYLMVGGIVIVFICAPRTFISNNRYSHG